MSVGCFDQLIYYLQQLFIGGNILHRIAIVGITDKAIFIHNTIQRHAAQLEKVDLLAVLQCHPVLGVWQANKRNSLIPPILFKSCRWVGPHCQNDHIPTGKLFIFVPQARQLRAAIGSLKAAQKSQDHRLAAKIR